MDDNDIFAKAWLFLIESVAEAHGGEVSYVRLERQGEDGGTTIFEKGTPSHPMVG